MTTTRARTLRLVLAGAAYAAALAVLGRVVLAPHLAQIPAGVALPFLAATHAVVLLGVVPGLAREDRAPDPRAWIRLGVLVLGGLVGCLAAGPERGALPGLVVGAFGAMLLGLRDLLRALGVPEAAARVTPVLVGSLLLTTLAWTGPLVEAMEDPSAGVELALRANPLAVAAGATGFDWARARPVTYDLFVGQYYRYAYPAPGAALAQWILLAAGLTGAALLVRRWRSE